MNTTLVILIMAAALLNILLFLRQSFLENKEKGAQPEAAIPSQEISVMGQTKTRLATEMPCPFPSCETVRAEPTETPDEGSPEIGEEFYPATDEIDDDDIEVEELLVAAGGDIRPDDTDLVAREIAALQKAHNSDTVPEEETATVRTALSKLDGSEFLRLLKENEEKAERRNRELLRLISEQEQAMPDPPPAAATSQDDLSLEDFL